MLTRRQYTLAAAVVLALAIAPVSFALVAGPEPDGVAFTLEVLDASGGGPNVKSAGDLNGDGRLDLVIGRSPAETGGPGGMDWYEAPAWTKHHVGNGVYDTDAEVADMNGDGRLDIVAIKDGGIVWLENLGAGRSWKEHRVADVPAHDVEVADLDGDGAYEIVARYQSAFGGSGATVFIFKGAGDSWSRTDLPCPDGEGLKVADIDGDGRPDIVVTDTWYRNPGTVNDPWQAFRYGDIGNGNVYIDAGDINGDGRLDIVLAPAEPKGDRGRIAWFEQSRTPDLWTAHVIDPDVETVQHFVGIGDFDQDGRLDVTAASMSQGGDGEVKIYLNNGGNDGGGSWTKQVIDRNASHSMRVVDLDGDGVPSLFGANWAAYGRDEHVKLWVNGTAPRAHGGAAGGGVTAAGTAWGQVGTTLGRHSDRGGPGPGGSMAGCPLSLDTWTYIRVDDRRPGEEVFGLTFADLDRDGRKDIVTGPVWYSNPGSDLTGAWVRHDLGAGYDAMVVIGTRIYAQRGTGVYVLSPDGGTARAIGALPGGVHRSASQDYAVAAIDGAQVPVFATESGTFYFAPSGRRVRIDSRGSEEAVVAADIDGDGNTDIVDVTETGVSWFRNPGSGRGDWEEHVIGTKVDYPMDRVEAADIDGDGRPDIVVTESDPGADDAGSLSWYAQRPDGIWERHPIALGLGPLESMDVADLDGDGQIDVVTGEHRGRLRTLLYENVGHGQAWVEHVVDTGKESHMGTRAVDLNNDGRLDIVSIAWDAPQDVHLWRNDNTPWRRQAGLAPIREDAAERHLEACSDPALPLP